MADSTFHIVYPCGDRSKLTVIELAAAVSYELSEYAVASRHSFTNMKAASDYARTLAKDNGLIFKPGKDQDGNEYLD